MKELSFCELRAIIKTLEENQKAWEDTNEPFFSESEIKSHEEMASQLRVSKEAVEDALYTKMWEFVHKNFNFKKVVVNG